MAFQNVRTDITSEQLEAAGFRETTVAEFLGLTLEEQAIVESRLALARLVRETRKRNKISQSAVSAKIKSAQSRIAALESGKNDASIELLMRAAVASGATMQQIGDAIANVKVG